MKLRLLITFLFIALAGTLVLAQQTQVTENGERTKADAAWGRRIDRKLEGTAKQTFAIPFELYVEREDRGGECHLTLPSGWGAACGIPPSRGAGSQLNETEAWHHHWCDCWPGHPELEERDDRRLESKDDL
jgi:hypothetical protein